MKNYIIILFVIIFGLISCQNKSDDKKNESSKLEIKTPEIAQKSNPIFSQNDFELVYEYSNGEDNQLLGINIVDKKTIKFHLVSKTVPCDTEYWGIAENKNWNQDPEIDEDENGAYPASEYTKHEAEYTISMRLASDSSKVIIKYVQEDRLETDCFPITEEIMKRIK